MFIPFVFFFLSIQTTSVIGAGDQFKCPANPPCKCVTIEDHKDPLVAWVQILTCPTEDFPLLKDVGNDTFYDVALRIENSGFKVIPSGALKHLSPRPVVQISRNAELESIEAGGLFIPRVGLLLIKDNPYLKTIHPGAFRSPNTSVSHHLANGSDAGEMSLRTLVIIADDISRLQPGVFEGLESFSGFCLLQLDKLLELNPGVFRHLQSLKQLEIRTGYVTPTKLSIKTGSFNGLFPANCSCCLTNSVKITGAAMIEPGAFANCSGLSFLSLNKVVKAESGALQGLHNLKHFDLNNEELNTQGISKRSRVHMDGSFFGDLPKLESLSLVKISKSFHIGDEIFERLEQLETLQMTQLTLAALPNSIKSLKSLSSLVISQVPLSPRGVRLFADQIKSLSNLETLQLAEVPLTSDSIAELTGEDLPHLTQISARCGKFSFIPTNITTFPCLQQWQITNCREAHGQPELMESSPCEFTEPCSLRSWARFNKNLVQMADNCESREISLSAYLKETSKLCGTHEINTDLPSCYGKPQKTSQCENQP